MKIAGWVTAATLSIICILLSLKNVEQQKIIGLQASVIKEQDQSIDLYRQTCAVYKVMTTQMIKEKE